MPEFEAEQSHNPELDHNVVERYPDGRPKTWVHKRRMENGGIEVFDPSKTPPEKIWHTIATAGERGQYGKDVLEMGHNPSAEILEGAELWVDEYRPDDGMGGTSAA
ncbi:MAG: hypothetical protein Q7S09_02150 [bacterium]|nr:hypothetical protein [bacterium]